MSLLQNALKLVQEETEEEQAIAEEVVPQETPIEEPVDEIEGVEETKTVVDIEVKEEQEASQEACTDCQTTQATHAKTSVFSSNLERAGGDIVVTNQDQLNNDKDLSFTYDEGKGSKEMVQLTGPLSEVYTRALNIYYAKKPVLDTDSIPEDISQAENEEIMASAFISPTELKEQMTVSKESVQLDDTSIAAVITEISQNKLSNAAQDKFVFVNDSIMTDIQNKEAGTVVFLSSKKEATKPEVIDTVQSAACKKNKNVILVVEAETKFFSGGMGMRRKWLDLSENSNYNPNFSEEEFKYAAEKLYAENGINVIFGFEGFVNYLNQAAV